MSQIQVTLIVLITIIAGIATVVAINTIGNHSEIPEQKIEESNSLNIVEEFELYQRTKTYVIDVRDHTYIYVQYGSYGMDVIHDESCDNENHIRQ